MSAFLLREAQRLDDYLLSYARRRIAPELARDVVQETWAAALAGAARFEGRSAPRTWMVAILKRKIADHYRRRVPLPLDAAPEGSTPLDPERVTLARLELEGVEARYRTLPAAARAAVDGCVAARDERSEVARRLGTNRDALRVALHRARRLLRNADPPTSSERRAS